LTEEDLARAVEHFERATRLDAAYAAAYAGLSHAWWWRGVWGATTFREIESPSRAAARKALGLDSRLAEAHVSMGRLKFGHDWDWTGAERDFRRAYSDEAFRLLFRHAEERNGLNYVKTEPRFDSLHADPRWPLLLRRMNLPVDSARDATVK
jgi:hypothetical protein